MPTTTYTIADADGIELFQTHDPDEAQTHSQLGFHVTAVTEGSA